MGSSCKLFIFVFYLDIPEAVHNIEWQTSCRSIQTMLPSVQTSAQALEKAICSHILIVMVDHSLSKGIVLTPCSKIGLTAEKTAQLYIDNVYSRFELAKKMISNRGPQFDSAFFKDLASNIWWWPHSTLKQTAVNHEVQLFLFSVLTPIECKFHDSLINGERMPKQHMNMLDNKWKRRSSPPMNPSRKDNKSVGRTCPCHTTRR